jgi:hypothetical protein
METLSSLRSLNRKLDNREGYSDDSAIILAYKRFLADDEFNLEDLRSFRQFFGESDDAQARDFS